MTDVRIGALINRIARRDVTLAIIGLGYVGLGLALRFGHIAGTRPTDAPELGAVSTNLWMKRYATPAGCGGELMYVTEWLFA